MAPKSTRKGKNAVSQPVNLDLNPAITLDTAMLQTLPPNGPARRTRAATKSPTKQKRPVRAPPKALTRRPLKRKAMPPHGSPSLSPPPATPPPEPTVPAATGSQQPVSPYHVPFRIRKTIRVPHDAVAFSQPRSDEEVIYSDEDLNDNVPHLSAGHLANPSPGESARFALDQYQLSSDSEPDLHATLSYNQEDGSTRLVFPTHNRDQTVDIELFQNGEGQVDGYLDLSPIVHAAEAEAARTTAAPTSPLAARAARRASPRRDKGKGRAPRLLHGRRSQEEFEAEAAAIIESTHDVLDAHRAKKRKKGPNAAMLAAVANQLAPPSNQAVRPIAPAAPNRLNAALGASDFTFSSRPNAVAGPSNAGNRPTTMAANSSNLAAHPIVDRSRVASLPTLIADAARQGRPLPEDDDFEQFSLSRKRKRSSQPAPHQIGSRSPNSRIVLRHGKERYALYIVTENAYPDPRDRVIAARASHDYAIQLVPDIAAIATGIHWHPTLVRLYGDNGWVKRGLIKMIAANLITAFFRLLLPPALADTLPGGASAANAAAYIQSRVLYLLNGGEWLRGNHGRHTSMLYAHPIIPEVIEQAIYRPMTAEQRAHLSPMPLPAIALTVTAIQCSLEEWKTGVHMKISFTEEGYGRVYRGHLKRLTRMTTSHAELLGTLRNSMYDYCVARNTVQQQPEPVSEDEYEDFNIFNSDGEEDADVLQYDVLESFEA